MPETLPMLSKDPRASFKLSRLLRIILFSLVASMAIVGLLIATVRFAWDNILAPVVGGGAYEARIELILPAIVFVTALMAKLLWDVSEERAPKLRSR